MEESRRREPCASFHGIVRWLTRTNKRISSRCGQMCSCSKNVRKSTSERVELLIRTQVCPMAAQSRRGGPPLANRCQHRSYCPLIWQDVRRNRSCRKSEQQEQEHASVLNWRRTSNDPFAGYWEPILSWVQANPTRSSGDIPHELQSRYPGRYEGSHLRTLQRGMRKIRAYLLQTQGEAGSPARLEQQRLFPAELSPLRGDPETLDASSFPKGEQIRSPERVHTRSSGQQQVAEAQLSYPGRSTKGAVSAARTSSVSKASQIVRHSSSASC